MNQLDFLMIVWIGLLSSHLFLKAQDTLYFVNPSFEDQPQHSHTPVDWINCGFPAHSPPDIGPIDIFGSSTQPAHGKSFVVLVTRDNNTWERISAPLSASLRPGQTYWLQLQLTRSATYFSRSLIVNKPINFAFPVRLRVWGSNTACKAQELLAQTSVIKQENWQIYTLEFVAAQAFTHLILEAYYDADADLPYPGNLCLDNLSPVMPIVATDINSHKLRQIRPPFVPQTSDSKLPVQAVDQMRLRTLLDDIKPDNIEQSLYALAIYQRSLRQPSWVIYVKRDGSRTMRSFKHLLKKQITAMNLEGHLSVDYYISAFQSMNWICTPQNGGLGLQKR